MSEHFAGRVTFYPGRKQLNMKTFTRRKAIKAVSGATASWLAPAAGASATELFVSPSGNDSHPGTRGKPLRTFDAAQAAARKTKKKEAIWR